MKPSRSRRDRIFLSVPHLDGNEKGMVSSFLDVAGDGRTHSTEIAALERDFSTWLGMPSIALGSGTAGIHLALKLAGIRGGDEVLMPSLTFVASCNPVLYEGAVPVFVDSEASSWNIDPNLVEVFLGKRAQVNRLPKAIVVVHLFGQSADMEPLGRLCGDYGVVLIEDAAEALGAKYKEVSVGKWGDIGVFSFNRNKVITGFGGGMLTAGKPDWLEKVRYWSNQACDPGRDYLHSEIGYNYRLSNPLAAIARSQLRLLEERVTRRRAIAFRYRDAFVDIPGIELMPQAAYGLHTNWLSCFLIDEQQFGMSQRELIHFLDAANIESRPVWKPMHTQKLYQGYECIGGEVAEDLNRRGICLPSSSSLSEEDQQFVIDRVREAHLISRAPSVASMA